MTNKNDCTVVPFAKPETKPTNDNGDGTPPEQKQFTVTLDNGKVKTMTGLLMFMPPFVGVGLSDGTVGYLANPEHLVDIEIDPLPVTGVGPGTANIGGGNAA